MQCQWATELQPNQRPVLHRCPTPNAGSFSPFAVLAHCSYSIGMLHAQEATEVTYKKYNDESKHVFAFLHMLQSLG